MAPPVLAELLSDPKLPASIERGLLGLPLMKPQEGFWQRAGKLRAEMFRRKYRPKLADSLIAQCCLDHGAPLLTRDRGFQPFTKHAGLILL